MAIDLKEYRRLKLVPTKLQYEDHYPSSTEYKTSDSIKFLKEFDFLKIRVLDLFCGGGGVSKGFYEAGVRNITGVDNRETKDYPFRFIKSNVFDLDLDFLKSFDFIWASPPCQCYSGITRTAIKREQNRGNPDYFGENLKKRYPDLLGKTRELLKKTGKPFVIENVENAPIRKDLMLCGTMFNLGIFRHRFFEIYGFYVLQMMHPSHKNRRCISVLTKQQKKSESFSICCEAMGIDWMTNFENLGEAIPPAYSKYIMEEFLRFNKEKKDYYKIKKPSSVLII